MLDEALHDRLFVGQGQKLMIDRSPQAPRPRPAGEVVVSADSHYSLVDDIFHERFPDHLRHRAPRVWWDEAAGIFQMGENFVSPLPPSAIMELHSIEAHPGARSLSARLADLDAEGIASEIVFPQILQQYFQHPDFEIRQLIFDIYNQHMASIQRASNGRSFPVAIPNYWDPASAPTSIRRITAMGFRAIMLPNMPGRQPNGAPVVYNSADYDPVWAAIEECGIVICHHIGETFIQDGVNGIGSRVMHDLSANLFRLHFGRYVFGRVLDKFPRLRIVFAEAGIGWVATALQDAEMIAQTHAHMFDSRPDQRPADYWRRNFWATFMNDPAGLRLLDIIGSDRVMWSHDYPHNESNFGFAQDSMQSVRDAVPQAEASRILGGTAIGLFGL